MADNRTKFPQHLYMDLSDQNFKIYDKEDNKSGLISKLLEEYYDPSIVKIRIDEKIKDAYNNDIFKEYRIPMLLLEFYTKGNVEGIKNEVSVSLANKNVTEYINEEIASITSSENKNTIGEITDTENPNIIEDGFDHDIKHSKEHTNEIEDNLNETKTINKKIFVNDDEASKSTEENGTTPRSGSLEDLLKGKKIPKNTKSIL